MTDDVAELVLADNRAQNAVLGIARTRAPEMLATHARMIDDLVAPHRAGPGPGGAAGARRRSPSARPPGPACARRSWPCCSRTSSWTSRPRSCAPTCPTCPSSPSCWPRSSRPAGRPVPGGGGRPPAAPRDRGHRAGQRAGQPRRHHLRAPAGRGRRRPRRPTRCARSGWPRTIFELPALWSRLAGLPVTVPIGGDRRDRPGVAPAARRRHPLAAHPPPAPAGRRRRDRTASDRRCERCCPAAGAVARAEATAATDRAAELVASGRAGRRWRERAAALGTRPGCWT